MMSAGGTFAGREYLTAPAWEAAHAGGIKADMGGMLTTRFTQGGLAEFLPCDRDCSALERDFNTGREGFYGWMGLGGSIFQWHRAQDIGFAFVPTSLHVLDFLNERGKVYQAEVLRCIDRINATHHAASPAGLEDKPQTADTSGPIPGQINDLGQSAEIIEDPLVRNIADR